MYDIWPRNQLSLRRTRSSPPMVTAPDAITIIFDDVLAVDFSESVVAAEPFNVGYPSKYNNTITIFDRLNTTDIEFMTLRASTPGSTLQLYGIAPPSQFNQIFNIGPFPSAYLSPEWKYSYHAPGYGGLHYTSPPNITNPANPLMVSQAKGFALDYAVVTVYPTTDLLGTTILVDDSSSSFIWHGSWTEENNFTLPVECTLPFTPISVSGDSSTLFVADMAPHSNTTHASQTVGDEFEFWFTGTSILVYGVTPSNPDPLSPPWLLRMSFTLDGAEPTMVNFTSQNPDSASLYEMLHFVYFNASNIPAGNHSLVGRILDVVGSTLPRARIDYITYKASFASQEDMPVLPPFAPTTMATLSISPTLKAKITSAAAAEKESNSASRDDSLEQRGHGRRRWSRWSYEVMDNIAMEPYTATYQ
ncbi:hypothetical protein C8F01DRAFT_1086607 [Mycena amicta]|nr:hypothetical protein C8F01DRAFT_1086607 [Mycena amicta]